MVFVPWENKALLTPLDFLTCQWHCQAWVSSIDINTMGRRVQTHTQTLTLTNCFSYDTAILCSGTMQYSWDPRDLWELLNLKLFRLTVTDLHLFIYCKSELTAFKSDSLPQIVIITSFCCKPVLNNEKFSSVGAVLF